MVGKLSNCVVTRARVVLGAGLGLLALAACATPFTVSVNDQAVYDPAGRLARTLVTDADLQGCINLAVRQQGLSAATELTVLSCPGSNIVELDNIEQLPRLRFLDLANNSITNITPLEGLTQLGGLNLVNNQVTDIGPLLNIPTLVSVSLLGNDNIPCAQIRQLQTRLGDNLTPPASCAR